MHIGCTVLLSLLLAAAANAENPLQNDPHAADVGRGVFRVYCSPCHGIRGQGARGPDLTQAMSGAGKSDDDLFRIVTQGSPGTEMPAWLAGAYTEIACYGAKGPVPPGLDRVPVLNADEVVALVDFLLAKVVRK